MNSSHTKTLAGGPIDAGPPVRFMHTGQHLLAGLLLVVGVIRALAMGDNPALAIGAALVFTLVYWYPVILRVPEKLASPVWFWLVTAVWVGTVVTSEEFTWLAFLLWLLAGQVFSLLGAVLYSVIVFALVVATPFAHSGVLNYAGVIGPLVGAIFALAISRGYLVLIRDAKYRQDLVTALHEAHTDTAALQDELALTQRHSGEIAERTRLAREIHDTVAQDLSSSRLLARAALDKGEDLRDTLEQVERIIARASGEVREIIAALTPSELEDQALPTAITRLASRFNHELRVDVHVEDIPALPADNEVALLRACQSALSNVQRHSGATRVAVSLTAAGDSVRLDVRDDGQGFDPESAQGYGLRLMNDRLRSLGGGLVIESSLGSGTALSAHVPIYKVDA